MSDISHKKAFTEGILWMSKTQIETLHRLSERRLAGVTVEGMNLEQRLSALVDEINVLAELALTDNELRSINASGGVN